MTSNKIKTKNDECHPISDYWLKLVERYFDASTTEAEEERLRLFLSSREAEADSRFDEARAVMGFMAMGRKAAAEKGSATRANSRPRPHRLRRMAYWSAAAVLVVASVAWASIAGYRSRNVCVAYIGGKEITNPEIVKQTMAGTLREVARPDDRPTIEQQMGDMLNIQ